MLVRVRPGAPISILPIFRWRRCGGASCSLPASRPTGGCRFHASSRRLIFSGAASYEWRTRRGSLARKPCDDVGRAWLGRHGHREISRPEHRKERAMWRTHRRDAVRPRLLMRIAACAPSFAAAPAGAGAPRSAQDASPPVSLSVAPQQGPRKSSSRSASRGPAQCSFWLTLSPALVAVSLFCLLGLAISAAVILHLPQDLLNWVLIHVE